MFPASQTLPFRTGWVTEKLRVVVVFAVLTQQKKERERERKHGIVCLILMGGIAGYWDLSSGFWTRPLGTLMATCMWKVKFVANLKILGRCFPSVSGFSSRAQEMVELPAGWSLWCRRWSPCPHGRVWRWEGGREGGGARWPASHPQPDWALKPRKPFLVSQAVSARKVL